ncbi:MAG TPA: glycosyltransferase family 4 protein [Candidatus Kapabacteria bacterium]|nr:glycosyltransferase family 4 protein [Candidatus Kapabacteria bacterium]
MAKKLNIVVLVPRIVAPPVDGGSHYVYKTIKSIADRGHNITFLCFKSDKHPQAPEMIEQFAKIHYTPLHFKEYNLMSLLKSVLLWKPATTIERMDKGKMKLLFDKLDIEPDFFFLEGIHAAEMIDYIKKKYPLSKIVLRQANVEYTLFERSIRKAKNPIMKIALYIQKVTMRNYEQKAILKSDLITTVSDSDTDVFKSMVPNKKYQKVLNMLDKILYDRSRGRGNLVLAFGDWNWHPNRSGMEWFLAEVYPLIKDYNFELNIVGRGFDGEYFKGYPQINYLGFVEDLEQYIANADFMIAPLVYGGGTKVKVIEALSKSLPIITSEFGNEGIEAEHNKEIMIVNNAHEFALAFEKLLNHDEFRLTISKNAYQFATNKYNNDKIIDDFIKELYKLQN